MNSTTLTRRAANAGGNPPWIPMVTVCWLEPDEFGDVYSVSVPAALVHADRRAA